MMTRLEQSIEVNVPATTVYNQLTQFEDYPRFMEDIEEVRQLDDTHLHWRAKMNSHDMEWDAEIMEQVPDKTIAWRNMGGPVKLERVEVRPLEQEKSKVTMTMEYEEPQQQASGQESDLDVKIAEHAVHDLMRLKKFLESRRRETGAWRGEVHQGQELKPGGNGAAAAQATSAGGDGAQRASAAPAGQQQPAGQEPAGQQAGAQQPQGEQPQGQQPQGQQPQGQQPQGQQPSGQQPSGQKAAEQQAGGQQAAGQPSPGTRPDGQQAGAQPAAQQQPPPQQTGGQPSGGAQPAAQQTAEQQPSAQKAAAHPGEQQPSGQPGAGGQQAGVAIQPGGQAGGQVGSPQQQGMQGTEQDSMLAAMSSMSPQSWLPSILHAWEEPFVMMRRMTEDMDQIFERFLGRPMYGAKANQAMTPAGATWSPPLEVAQRDNQLVVRADLPGVKQEDVHVEIKNDRLVIEGDRRPEQQREGQGFSRTERSYGHFYRALALPDGINPEQASASMRDGVLEVLVPVQQTRQQGRHLNIRSSQ